MPGRHREHWMSVRGRRSPKLPAPGVASNPGEFVMPACSGHSAGDHRLAQKCPRESRAFVNHQRGQVWLLGSLAVSGDAVQYWPRRASDSAVRRRHFAVRRQGSIVPFHAGNEKAPCDVHVQWSAAETGHGSIDTRSCAGSPDRRSPSLVHARPDQSERPRTRRYGVAASRRNGTLPRFENCLLLVHERCPAGQCDTTPSTVEGPPRASLVSSSRRGLWSLLGLRVLSGW